MNEKEIISLIKSKELEINRLKIEVDLLKKQFIELRKNKTEAVLSREDKVKIFIITQEPQVGQYGHDKNKFLSFCLEFIHKKTKNIIH